MAEALLERLEDRDVQSQTELLYVLRQLRLKLIENSKIANAVLALRQPVSRWDFWFSFLCLIVGTAGQGFFAMDFLFLIPVFLLLQLFGLAGFNSLAHEAWHNRAYPGRHASKLLSVWFIAPLLFRNHGVPRQDHIVHHQMPGEDDDPTNVWEQSVSEFRHSLLRRILILPAAWEVAKGLFTGRRANLKWKDNEHALSKKDLFRVAIVHTIWFGGLLILSPPAVIFGWALPLCLGSAAAHLREYRRHSRMPEGKTAVYDILCNNFQRCLVAGGYFNYHALHHLFPEIPQRNLPKLYKVISSAVDMDQEYYGFSPQIARLPSYFLGL